MPIEGDQIGDLAGLKTALLQFLVREFRANEAHLGPVSPELADAIAQAVEASVLRSIGDFEARRLAALADALEPAVTGALSDGVRRIALDLASTLELLMARAIQMSEEQAARSAREVALQAITVALNDTSVAEAIGSIDERLRGLQQTIQLVIEHDLRGAAAQAASEAGRDPPFGERRSPADPREPRHAGLRAAARRPLLWAGLSGLALALVGAAVFGASQVLPHPGATSTESPTKAPIDQQFDAVAARGALIGRRLQAQTEAAGQLALLLGASADGRTAQRLERESTALTVQAAALTDAASRDAGAAVLLGRQGADGVRLALPRLQAELDDAGRLQRAAVAGDQTLAALQQRNPGSQDAFTGLANDALATLQTVETAAPGKAKAFEGIAADARKRGAAHSGQRGEFDGIQTEASARAAELAAAATRVPALRKSLQEARDRRNWASVWALAGEAGHLGRVTGQADAKGLSDRLAALRPPGDAGVTP